MEGLDQNSNLIFVQLYGRKIHMQWFGLDARAAFGITEKHFFYLRVPQNGYFHTENSTSILL